MTPEHVDLTLDGHDHINVYSRGSTALGRFLTNVSLDAVRTRHGLWPSVENYWFWLRSGMRNDRYRDCTPFEARQFGKTEDRVELPEFDLYIQEALTNKVVLGRMLSVFVSNRLPLYHYYYYGKPDNAKIVIPGDNVCIPWLERLHEVLTRPVIRLNVLGSRQIDPKPVPLEAIVERLGRERVEIVTGLARGPDRAGKRLGEALGLRIHEFPADWDRLGRRAGHVRNAEMAQVTDLAVVYWDGVSRGTAGMIEILQRARIPYALFLKPA